MAMKKAMTDAELDNMLARIRKGVTQFGSQFSVPYSIAQMSEALVMLADKANLDAPSREEYNKLSRQLAACTSREKGLRNRLGGNQENVANTEETGS